MKAFFVACNCLLELCFHSQAKYADPYNEVVLDVQFNGPDGVAMRVPAFWAGDDVWKVRFAGPKVGEYSFQTECSNVSDSGLHGQTGTVTVRPYEGASPLMAHGRLRVAADKRHFEQADGTPFFWIGDTWWMGLTSRLDWPRGFQLLTADRAAKGFNVVQIIAGPYPDMDAFDPRGASDAGFPLTEGFERVNPTYFDLADLKMEHLVHEGIMPCIVGMWGYYMPQMHVEKAKRYWRYLVARYGALPVVWCICGEGMMPYYLSKTPKEDAAEQRKGWTEVMAYVRQIDGHHNLIGIHPTQYGREQVEDPALMDFEMLQTGHGDFDSVNVTAGMVMTATERTPIMPIVNAEVNYEGLMGRSWQNVVRMCFYGSVLNGTAGHTYGANGIWQMSTAERPYGPSPHGRCWGNTPWEEAYKLPGSKQVGLGGQFIRRFPWWALERHPEWAEPSWDKENVYSCTTVGIPRKLRIVYVPLLWDPPTVKALESDVKYEASYFDPCTGADIALGAVTPDPDGGWRVPLPPEAHDWLLVLRAA